MGGYVRGGKELSQERVTEGAGQSAGTPDMKEVGKKI